MYVRITEYKCIYLLICLHTSVELTRTESRLKGTSPAGESGIWNQCSLMSDALTRGLPLLRASAKMASRQNAKLSGHASSSRE